MRLFRSSGPAAAFGLRLKHAAGIATLLIIVRVIVVGGAAWADGSLYLPGRGTGLLEHPGAVAVLFGDSLLILICFQVRRMTALLGRRLPSAKPILTRRYFRSVLFRRATGLRGDFSKAFAACSLFGMMCIENQSLAAMHAVTYYGHDTFDSIEHWHTFWAVRASLLISWGIILPWFAALLFVHCVIVSRLVVRARNRGLSVFIEAHPDRCGGYAFFGWADVAYAAGIAVALCETAFLIITHGRITLGSGLALIGAGVGAGLVSVLSIKEVLKTVRGKERSLKSSRFFRIIGPVTVDYTNLMYTVNFSPYTYTASKLAVAVRAMMVAPAIYRFAQLFHATT